MLAELGQFTVDERPRRCGHDDLTAVARSGNAGGTVQLATGVALAGQLQLARVQPHPYLDLDGRERILTLRRTANASTGSANAYRNASPCVSTSTPPCAERTPRRSRRCSASACT